MTTKTSTPKSSKAHDATINKKRKRKESENVIVSKSAASKKVVDVQDCPKHTLIIDNGGDTVKYGWSDDTSAPHIIPNVTARLQQQWTVLVGDELATIQNPTQLIGITRSTERGVITNMGSQIQVWKRVLDKLRVSIPLTTTTAQSFGWHKTKRSNDEGAPRTIVSANCAVVIALPPFYPRTVLDHIMTVWMEDFGFSRVGFTTAQLVASRLLLHEAYKTCCLVDLGYSATHIMPVFGDKVVDHAGIRRLPLGARHLINIWKFQSSYRQWNLMDQEWLLRQILEEAGYVSLDFANDIKLAQYKPSGRRPYDREFVLPDFQTTFLGKLQLPQALLRASILHGEEDEDLNNESEDEDFDEDDVSDGQDDEEEVDDENNRPRSGKSHGRSTDDTDEDSDDEEETLEQARRRLAEQRVEDERRRRALEGQQQILKLSVERFAIPEVLFRPSDVGLSIGWCTLPQAIAQSILACPDYFRPALCLSIKLIGGLSKLMNLKERLEVELRSIMPCQYNLSVDLMDQELNRVWFGTQSLVTTQPFHDVSVSRIEWDAKGRKGAYERLLAVNGGSLI